MTKLWQLIKGEILRLFRYKIVFFSVLVSLIWILIIALSDNEAAIALVPFLVLMDAAMMSIILLGSSFFLEKQEGTMQSLLVTPVTLVSVLVAKIISALFMTLLSFLIVIGSTYIFHDFHAPVLLLLLYTLLVVMSHTALGYVITLFSRDFMQMLFRYMGIFLLFLIPMVLVLIDVIPQDYDFLVLLSPTYSGQILFQSTIITVEPWKVVFASIYLFLIAITLYPTVVFRKFQKVALEG